MRRLVVSVNTIADQVIERIAAADPDSESQGLLKSLPGPPDRELVLRIADAVVQVARQDLVRAERLANAARWLAEVLDDDFCRGRGARAMGNVSQQLGRYADAELHYSHALEIFERLGDEVETGRTLVTSLQPLMYLAKYDEANRRADCARAIFEQQGDRLRLARLDICLGNILHRQDRFEDAMGVYRHAEHELSELEEYRDRGVVLLNMAVCLISLQDLAEAQAAYEKAREYCRLHDMPLLVAQADYNIAYLYYYRGEYTRAIELYQASAEFCARVGDGYHSSLCDLDRAEMYLDLRLTEEACRLAQSAFVGFERLGLGYESAKATAFRAIATDQLGQPFAALELLAHARELFLKEQNQPWPAVLDLYSAIVLYRQGRLFEAKRSCRSAQQFLSHARLRSKAAAAEILWALLCIRSCDTTEARSHCEEASRLLGDPAPQSFKALIEFALAESFEAEGNFLRAFESLRSALAALERAPLQRQVEDLKIPLLNRATIMHEAFVAVGAELSADQAPDEEIFMAIEKAKAREVAELVAFRAQSLPALPGTRSGLVEELRSLREELNWYYRQIDSKEMQGTPDSPEAVELLRARTLKRESEFADALREWSHTDPEFLSLQSGEVASISAIRGALAQDTAFVQYFEARGAFYAVTLDHERCEVRAVASLSHVKELVHTLREEFTKAGEGRADSGASAERRLRSCRLCLRKLYTELFEPIGGSLGVSRLVIAPHNLLYSVPFHALFDGEAHLGERYTISYMPSGSQLAWCTGKRQLFTDRTVIFGDDAETQETKTGITSTDEVITGAETTFQRFQEQVAGCREVYWNTRAEFRRDNPLFSTLEMGDSRLRFLDLFNLRLPVGMICLTGCEPGIDTTGESGALVALLRGLFYAGAESVVIPLWKPPESARVNGLKQLHRHLAGGSDRATALQHVASELRRQDDHPYYWAAWTLWGSAATTKQPTTTDVIPSLE